MWYIFPNWVEYCYAIKDKSVQGGKYVKNHYRYSKKYNQWQIYYANYGADWWENCLEPKEINDLILYSDWIKY
jgi:hypothetical protein